MYSKQNRAVLTNGHTGHVPRDPGFFYLRGPQLLLIFCLNLRKDQL